MLDTLHRRIDRLATWPVVALLLGAFLACQVGFSLRQPMLGPLTDLPDVRPGYTPSEVRDLFEDWGEDGRRFYVFTQLTLDVAVPLTFGLLLAVGLVQVFPFAWSRWLLLVPLLAAGSDLAENALLGWVAWTHDGRESPLVWVANYFTAAKFALIAAALALLLVGGLLWLRRGKSTATAGPR